ncbi:hypothetical protein F5X96DRAFT_667654 [Biscogniauxia mediterranea]|nr:hypothetical protein F5X96DRAFT_667654 [Biscogniauxia mediterranea]
MPPSHRVDEWALEVCNGTTVNPTDLVKTDSVRLGQHEVQLLRHVWRGPERVLHYLKERSPDEALIFRRFFDSDPRESKLHMSSIQASSTAYYLVPENAKPREESIEVRALGSSSTRSFFPEIEGFFWK